MIRALAGVVVVFPLLVGMGSPSPEPNRPTVQDCPFEIDPDRIRGTFLGWLRVEMGQQLVHTRTWRDPDGDSARVELLEGPEGMQLYNKPKMNSYTLVWTPTRVELVAVVLRVTDDPRPGIPASSTGTILIQVVPPDRRAARGLCGGRPG